VIPPTSVCLAGVRLSPEKLSRSARSPFHRLTPCPLPRRKSAIRVLEQVQPGDLIRYGLIPEFVGRLPVAGVMNDLDKNALVRILTEPKNALSAIPATVRIRKRPLRLQTMLSRPSPVGSSAQGRRARLAHDSRRPHAGTDVPPAMHAKCATFVSAEWCALANHWSLLEKVAEPFHFSGRVGGAEKFSGFECSIVKNRK